MKLFYAVYDAFKNKRTRPRAIIWLGTIATALVLVVTIGVSATTSYWFCAAICHYPQFDTVESYNNSTHTAVACVTCHKQPGADPISFLLFKVEALFTELPPTLARTSDMPINPLSELSMNPTKIPSKYCTQCHRLENRGGEDQRGEPNTSQGIIMNHWSHTDLGITCTACHNRVGHNEGGSWQPHGYELTESYGVVNQATHDNFMRMTACYRCHRFPEDDGQVVSTPYPVGEYAGATGDCRICHTEHFDLVPDNHKEPHFVDEVHGIWYLEIAEQVQTFVDGPIPTYNDLSEYDQSNLAVRALDGVPNVRAINYCYTCHTTKYCDDCHGGISMPHSAEYKMLAHIDDGVAYPESCGICHITSAANNTERAGGGDTCSACHHSEQNTGRPFDTAVSWEWIQHGVVALQVGAESCYKCHSVSICSTCHVGSSRR